VRMLRAVLFLRMLCHSPSGGTAVHTESRVAFYKVPP